MVVTMRRNTAERNFQLEGLLETFGDLVWDLRTTRKLIDGDAGEHALLHLDAAPLLRGRQRRYLAVRVPTRRDRDRDHRNL